MAVSNLQVGLAIAGGLVLAAVVAHGAWTSRKNKPRQAEPELPRMDPMDAAEPGFSNAELDEQTRDTLVEMDQAMILPTVDKHASIDALIDVIAAIEIDAPISGEAALSATPATRRVGSKLFNLEGLNTETGLWEHPRNGQRYSAFQSGVQLANRTGPLNEIEFSEFVVKAQAFADSVDGDIDFPEMRDEVARLAGVRASLRAGFLRLAAKRRADALAGPLAGGRGLSERESERARSESEGEQNIK
jgi:hypothetical protein